MRSFAAALIVAGCLAPPASAIDLFAKKKDSKGSAEAALLQQEVMDFSDAYALVVGQEVDKYLRQEKDPQKRLAGETWKTLHFASAMAIAAGRDPASNLLDMYVFMALVNQSTRKYWVPQVFGSGASGLNTAQAKLLGEIEATVLGVLSAGQKEEIDGMISDWQAKHREVVYVAGVRLRDLAELRSRRTGTKSGPVPVLADVQKAVGEVDAAVQVAERMMFYLERLPLMATLQTSLAIAQAGAAPAVLSVEKSAESASQALTALPLAVNESVATNAAVIKDILPEIRASLDATREVLASAERLNAGKSDGASWTKDDVLVSLQGLEASAREVGATLQTAERLLGRASEPVTAEATATVMSEVKDSGRAITDHAYRRALQLVLIFLAGQALIVWVVLRARGSKRR
jgi:hypothetical protein